MLLSKLRQRLQQDEGFTLIELLVVLVIIAVLLAIAVPSYLGFKDRAEKRAAASNVRATIPAVEAWYSDHNNYSFGSAATLRLSYDAGLAATVVATPVGSGASYCVSDTQGTHTYRKAGPAATITSGAAC